MFIRRPHLSNANSLVPDPTRHLPSTAEHWSLLNALALLGGTAAGGLESPWPVLVIGAASFGLLGWRTRSRWTPSGQFGAANTVTAVRAAGLGLFPLAAVDGWILVGLGGAFLVADGLDGWLARRRGLSSTFGAFFDKEVDALFVLVLCVLAVYEGRLPAWIVGIGLLRYGFVILLFLLPTPAKTERRFSFARYAHGAMVASLLASFLPYPHVYGPLVTGAAGALLLSFGGSTVRLVTRGRQVPTPRS